MDGAGVVRAVIVVALDLGQLVRAVLETPLPRGASMMLVDANGVILGRVPEGEGWTGELVDEPLRRLLAERPAGMHEGGGLDGAPTLFLVEPLLRETSRAWDAAVVIALPRQAVFRAADRLFMLAAGRARRARARRRHRDRDAASTACSAGRPMGCCAWCEA